jgi:tetratricopeptide (TPR) repeat protein
MEPVRRALLEDALRFYQSFLTRKQNDPQIRREVALAYLRLGIIHRDLGQTAESEADYQKAFALVDALAADGPLDADFRVKLIVGHIGFAETKRRRGQVQDEGKHIQIAAAIGEELVQAFPNRPDYAAELASANLFLANGLSKTEPAQAEKILRRNLTLTSSPWQLRKTYASLGRLALDQKRYADAEPAFREAVKLADAAAAERPWDAAEQRYRSDTFRGLARALAGSGRLAEASEILGQSIAMMDKLVADHPEIPEWRWIQGITLAHRAQVLEQLERTVEAEAAYRKSFAIFREVVAKEPSIAQYQQTAWAYGRILGKFLLQRGRIEDAQEVYAQAAPFLERHPGDVPTRRQFWKELFGTNLDLGRRLAKMGNAKKADLAFEQAAAIADRLQTEFSADNGQKLQLAEILATASQSFRNAGKVPEAERFAKRALELLAVDPMPQTYEAWFQRGVAHAKLGQWEKALADQTKTLELRPDFYPALWRHGEAYIALKQWDKAFADFDKAIEMKPEAAGGWHYRGIANANRGQWDKALADYDKAIELGATDPSIWVSKAAAHAQLGQAETAIAVLQQAVARGFRNAAVLKTMPRLAPLRPRDDFKKLVAELEAKQK